jgi:hypothetical protein
MRRVRGELHFAVGRWQQAQRRIHDVSTLHQEEKSREEAEEEERMTEGDWDIIGTHSQGPVKTHGPDRCAGTHCVIHNPSGHHMKDWPLSFRMDLGALAFRECPCGMLHPDPDSIAYFAGRLGLVTALSLLLHYCCEKQCCNSPEGYSFGME